MYDVNTREIMVMIQYIQHIDFDYIQMINKNNSFRKCLVVPDLYIILFR